MFKKCVALNTVADRYPIGVLPTLWNRSTLSRRWGLVCGYTVGVWYLQLPSVQSLMLAETRQ
jgi:hypothetical protein